MRVVCISTTVMDAANPRYSTSDALLEIAAAHAREALGAEAKVIRLNDLRFRSCEGYYSKSAQACTWPCSITQMDPGDQLDVVYEAIVHWADVILIASPIRWGSASSLYFKMVERMNCIQNQVTIRNRVLLKNKVAAFIITGGQDNVQAVAGQMLGFFAEIGCVFPQFPYIAHSRGWSAEDMERNIAFVRKSDELHEAARELVGRAVETARFIVTHSEEDALAGRVEPMIRAGRKASGAEMKKKMVPMNLVDARIQLHHALQPAAGVGRTLLPPLPDDSHQSFSWSDQYQALVQDSVEGGLRPGLRLRDMTLLLIGPDGVTEYPLRGRRLEDGFKFFEERVGRMLVRPGEAIPDHAVTRGSVFMPDDEDLMSLASMYADAASVLERVRAKHPNAGPVRCWPHHFDIAISIVEGERTIGAGFVPGDEGIPEPYWYVYSFPAPATAPRLAIGEWHTGGWTGAVLKTGADAERFLEEAIVALR
jgi:multimeric flavodoxin WrbA